MSILRLLFLFVGFCVSAADWPTYMGDDARSGVSTEQLKLPLKQSWTHQPLHAPRPAWRGPAKRDLYNKVGVLKNRQMFDHAFHVIADAKHVYFGSSADDQVHCLDLNSGEERWSFFTEGPVRFAPTLHDGRLFVGSDDGHAYCLSTDGKYMWKKLLASRDYRIAGNNRIISAWPLRTGILVRDGIAYAGAGMFPKEEVYLMALDSVNGELKWREGQKEWPAQGYLLLSESRVFVPTGRSNPIVYNRNNHERDKGAEKALAGTRDAFTLIKWNGKSQPNPRQSGRVLGSVEGEKQDSFATFTGNHMIVADGKSYLQANDELSVLDRMRYRNLLPVYKAQAKKTDGLKKERDQLKAKKSPELPNAEQRYIASSKALEKIRADARKCVLWRTPCNQPYALILAGDTLFAGGENEVVAYAAKDGKRTWSASVSGTALGIAVAHGRLLVSTDKGTIHCFGAK
jgi:outer membrane protein assembly factor BamB